MNVFARTVWRGATWVLLPLLLSPLAAPVIAGEGAVSRQAAADAMSRMMESMGLLGAGSGPANGAIPGHADESWGRAEEMGRQMMDGSNKTVPSGGLEGL